MAWFDGLHVVWVRVVSVIGGAAGLVRGVGNCNVPSELGVAGPSMLDVELLVLEVVVTTGVHVYMY